MFFDVDKFFGSHMIIENMIRIDFQKEMRKDGSPYIAVFCKVHKKDIEKFENTMLELRKKILICGYSDYDEFCEKFFSKIPEQLAKIEEEYEKK